MARSSSGLPGKVLFAGHLIKKGRLLFPGAGPFFINLRDAKAGFGH